MTEPTEQDLKSKVEELIRDNRILLFMKGTPEQPQCGFSMRVVNTLESYGVEYAALDVLPLAAAARARSAGPTSASTSRSRTSAGSSPNRRSASSARPCPTAARCAVS